MPVAHIMPYLSKMGILNFTILCIEQVAMMTFLACLVAWCSVKNITFILYSYTLLTIILGPPSFALVWDVVGRDQRWLMFFFNVC